MEDYQLTWLPLKTFALHEYDRETGLYYAQQRWYDPETGSFTSEDGAQDGLNWYAYCGGSPVGSVDPSGMDDVANEGNNYCGYGSWGDYSYAMSCAQNFDINGSAWNRFLGDIGSKYGSMSAYFMAAVMGDRQAAKLIVQSAAANVELNDSKEGHNGRIALHHDGLDMSKMSLKEIGNLEVGSKFLDNIFGYGFKYDPATQNFTRKGGLIFALYKTDSQKIIAAFLGYGNKGAWSFEWALGWIGNVAQNPFGMDLFGSFTGAVKASQYMKDTFKNNIILTGQSLGGALASIGSIKNDLPAITFNAEGLNPGTIGMKKEDMNRIARQNILALDLKGEFLWGVQDNNLNMAKNFFFCFQWQMGVVSIMVKPAVGNRNYVEPYRIKNAAAMHEPYEIYLALRELFKY